MKFLVIFFLVFSPFSYAESIFKCKNENGRVAFQNKPCKGTEVKKIETTSGFTNENFKNEMIKTLAKMTGKSEKDLHDPRLRQAAEGFAAVDAAKSYAFTKIYDISAKHCGKEVKGALATYKSGAADIIALGQHYYSKGIYINIDGKKINTSGNKLTRGLNDMLKKLDKEHKTASNYELSQKCKEAAKSLRALRKLYNS